MATILRSTIHSLYPVLVFIGFCCLVNTPTLANQSKIDSIKSVISSTKVDSIKIKSIFELSNYYYLSNPDTTIVLCKQALALSQDLGYEKGVSESFGWLAYLYNNKGEVTKALEYNLKSLEFAKKKGAKKDIAVLLNNLGYMYKKLGKIEEALNYYDQSLKIREEINDVDGIAASLNNLGLIYDGQNEKEKAIKCYEKSLSYFEQAKDTAGITYALNNIGAAYTDKHDHTKALEYYKNSLALKYKIDDWEGIALTYLNIGLLLKLDKQLDSSLFYGNQSLIIAERIKDKQGMASAYILLSDLYYRAKDFDKSEETANESYNIAKKLGYPEIQKESAHALYNVFYQQKKWEKALMMYTEFNLMKDSLFNSNTEKAAVKQELRHQYEKEKAISDKEHEKNMAVANEQKKRQRIVIFAVVGVLTLILIFSIIIWRRLKITREQKSIIEEQHEELFQYNEEILTQRDQIERQKEVVEEHQKEIISSINYAQRIQSALLKSEDREHDSMLPHWILLKPRDIVSGDFYWIKKIGDYGYIAAADCTGHGVPGAFMSMLGVAFLNEIIGNDNELSPASILDQLRAKVINELSQKGRFQDTKDGMDISLLKFDCKNVHLDQFELEWAGANNPLYFIRNGELTEIEPDKQPIGYREKSEPFTNHKITVIKGDHLFLFSDGYWDQFGGDRNRKLGRKNFRELLYQTTQMDQNACAAFLENQFETWKGHEEQIDDVLVIGVYL